MVTLLWIDTLTLAGASPSSSFWFPGSWGRVILMLSPNGFVHWSYTWAFTWDSRYTTHFHDGIESISVRTLTFRQFSFAYSLWTNNGVYCNILCIAIIIDYDWPIPCDQAGAVVLGEIGRISIVCLPFPGRKSCRMLSPLCIKPHAGLVSCSVLTLTSKSNTFMQGRKGLLLARGLPRK